MCEISNVRRKVQYFPSIPVIFYVRQQGQLSPRGMWLGVWTGQETCNEAGWWMSTYRQKRRGVLRGTVGKPQPEGQELLRRKRILLTVGRAFVESAPR